MNSHLKRHLVLCDCLSAEHQAIFQYYDDEEPPFQLVYMDVHLVSRGNIFKNLWRGIRWAFGYKSVFGDFDEIVISPDEAKNIINFLQEFLDTTKNKEENENVQT